MTPALSLPPGFADTNVLVRYLTGDPVQMARQARAIVENAGRLLVTEGILNETAYVLMSFYGMPRAAVVDLLVELVARSNVDTWQMDEERVTEALLLCRDSGRVSLADAMLWAVARSTPVRRVYTFDQRFPAEGLERLSSG
ncbi:MAG TPA: PIN domain-containing protein [Chloroflexota bacterium]|nr:PIN domain-containing protein [Chloroflexota bacterium]